MNFRHSLLLVVLSLSMAACTIHVGHPESSPAPQPVVDESPAPSNEQNGTDTPTPDIKIRNSGSATPIEVVIQAHFRDSGSPIVVKGDDGLAVVLFNSNLDLDDVSPKVNDQIETGKAKEKKILAPAMGACKSAEVILDYIAGPFSNGTVMMDGSDAPGKSDCQDFLKAVAANGITLEFADAPLMNAPSQLIKKVTVTISPRRP